MFFQIANLFYKRAFWFYKPLYFAYKNVFELEHIAYLKIVVKPGMVVLDVGANIGFYTTLFSKLVGENGKVIAFEPETTNFQHLRKATASFSNVVVKRIAVGDKNTNIKLYLSDKLNVDHRVYDNGEKRSVQDVKCIKIDDFLKGLKVDVIKVDTQGFDYFVVKGARRLIRRSKKMVLFGELWAFGLKKSGVSEKKYLELLRNLGFRIKLNNNTANISDPNHYTDFVAIKS